ncbi:MAG: ABC transporter substrate binding protein [Acidobacteriota bacterium]
MSRSIRLLLVLAAVWAVAAPAGGPLLAGGTGRLVGRVTDEGGRRISGVRIQVTGRGAVGIYEATSDVKGVYAIPGLPLGEPLEVRAETEGRSPVIYVGVYAREGSGNRRDFRLRPAAKRIYLVLLDARVPYHRMALEGIRATLRPDPQVVLLSGDPGADARLLRRIDSEHPNAIVAIGSRAARLSRRWIKDIPVVYTMVLDPVAEDLSTTNLCGITLNGGFDDQLARLALVKPDARRVATIYNPRTLAHAVGRLRRAARDHAMELVARPAREAARIPAVLETLDRQEIDAFFLLLDPELMDIRSFEMIRRYTASRNLVFIVPDSSLVAVGGTFSFTPGFRELGAQAARMVARIILDGEQPALIGATFPETRRFALNPVEARRLGIPLSVALQRTESLDPHQVEDPAALRVETP